MRNFDSPTKAGMEADISSGDFRVFSSSDGFPYFVAPVFSTPAFSTPAIYSRIFHSRIFSAPVASRPTQPSVNAFDLAVVQWRRRTPAWTTWSRTILLTVRPVSKCNGDMKPEDAEMLLFLKHIFDFYLYWLR